MMLSTMKELENPKIQNLIVSKSRLVNKSLMQRPPEAHLNVPPRQEEQSTSSLPSEVV